MFSNVLGWWKFDIFIHGHFCNNHASSFYDEKVYIIYVLFILMYGMGWDAVMYSRFHRNCNDLRSTIEGEGDFATTTTFVIQAN